MNGRVTTRIDYLAVPPQVASKVAKCWVPAEIDLATKIQDDHRPVMARCSGLLDRFEQSMPSGADLLSCPRRAQPKLKFDKYSLACPARRARFEMLLQQSRPLQAYSADLPVDRQRDLLDERADGLAARTLSAALDSFTVAKAAPRKEWLSDLTWSLVQTSNSLRSQARRWRRSCAHRFLTVAWVAWQELMTTSTRTTWQNARVIFPRIVVQECRREAARMQLAISAFEALIMRGYVAKRAAIRRDKVIAIEKAAREAQHASDCGDAKRHYAIVRKLSGTRAAPLATVTAPDGTSLTSTESITARWREHFQAVLKADLAKGRCGPMSMPAHTSNPIPSPESWEQQLAAQRGTNTKVSCPTSRQVHQTMLELKESAVGPDMIPASVIKAGSHTLADEMQALISDTLRLRYVPLRWRGGDLVTAHKKGPASDPNNHRGLLVADHLSKVLTASLAEPLAEEYHKQVGKHQFGAASRRSTAMAALSLRTFLSATAAAGLCTLTLFLDLTKAFDFAVRELVLGWLGPLAADTATQEHKVQHLVRLGIPQAAAHDVAREITLTGGLLNAAGVPRDLKSAIASLHSGAWFQLRGDKDYYLHSVSGGRQGCRLGAVLFYLCYSIALRRIRKRLSDLGVLLHIVQNDPGKPWWASNGAELHTDCAEGATVAPEATYIDDHVAMLVARSPQRLFELGKAALQVIREELGRLGFVINWKPGKTEAFVSLRGHGAAEAIRQLAAADWTMPAGCDTGAPQLRIVKEYKYLGSWVADDGGVATDPSHRSASMLSAYAPLSFKVFGSHVLPVASRMNLFRSLCLSRLVYGVEVWLRISATAYATLNAAYHRGLRRIAGACMYGGSEKVSNEAVRVKLGAPSLQCIIMKRRLLLFLTLARSDLHHIHCLLSCCVAGGAPSPWVQQVVADLRFVAAYHNGKLAELGDPVDNASAWLLFMLKFPGAYSALIKNIHVTTMPLDRRKDIVKLCSPGPLHLACSECSASFYTEKALLAHRRVKHEKHAKTAKYVGRCTLCPVCCTKFASRTRLVAHLAEQRARGQRGTTCGHVIRAGLVRLPSAEDFEHACESDRAKRAHARKRGKTQPLAEWPAKRLKTGGSLANAAEVARKKAIKNGLGDQLPTNILVWSELRPVKRLRTKVAPDDLLAAGQLTR